MQAFSPPYFENIYLFPLALLVCVFMVFRILLLWRVRLGFLRIVWWTHAHKLLSEDWAGLAKRLENGHSGEGFGRQAVIDSR
jgi:hypothetical protein